MKHLFLALSVGFMFFTSNAQNQQEETIYEIEDKVYSKKDFFKLTNDIELIEKSAAAYNVPFKRDKGYLVTYCYNKSGELTTSWVHVKTKEKFDELRYYWEDGNFSFYLFNSQNGEKLRILTHTLQAD